MCIRDRSSAQHQPRTPTGYARTRLRAAIRFLAWHDHRGVPLAECRQADVDDWLAAGPAGYPVRDFLDWAADHRHSPALVVPSLGRATGPATGAEDRWALVARLLTELIDTGRRYVGVGAPTASPWLFPGHGLERLPKRRAYRSANARSHTSKHLGLAHE